MEYGKVRTWDPRGSQRPAPPSEVTPHTWYELEVIGRLVSRSVINIYS